MYFRPISLRVALLAPLASLAALSAAAPDPVYTALRQSTIADSILVENIVLKRDAGVITLKSGSIGFTAPALGRDVTAVFVGDGEFVFTPPQAVEKNYLKSITDQEAVRESFDRALFCFTDATGKELRGEGKAQAPAPRLGEALRDSRKQLRYRSEAPRSGLEAMLTSEDIANIEADILADLYNPGQPGFFTAYLHGRKHGDLRFLVKPRGAMPTLPAPEEVALINFDPQGSEEGIWYLGHLESEIAAGKAGSEEDKRVVEAVSYKIETAIAGDHLSGSADFRFRAVTAGDRVIKFGLLPNLRVSRVATGSEETPFIQEDRKEDGSLYVILSKPLERVAEQALKIEYAGDKVVRNEGGGNFSVEARTSWYPSVNSFQDRAAYDLVFKVPKRYVLVSVGKLKEEWKEKDSACSEWISEAPMAVAGFNYGEYKKKAVTDPKTGVTIEGYAVSVVPDYLKGAQGGSDLSPTSMNAQAMAQAQAAMEIYGAYFGKAQFSRIAITEQPEMNFGQSWPTLVYLPVIAYLDSTERWRLLGLNNKVTAFVDEVTAHEVAHQYWGHMVGWGTFHDQWLSEGFANFSAGLYLQNTEKTPGKYLQYWEQARKRILEKNAFGRRPNDAGPLWLGLRLASFKNRNGYDGTVYDKGGYVLHMIRQLMYEPKEGDKYFVEAMQDYVREHLNRNATTESFQRTLEKHMRPGLNLTGDGKLDWFFSEWVYGTAIPRYKLDCELKPQPDGKWLIEGTLAQSEVPESFIMAVPLYADFDGQIIKLGAARMTGSTSVPVKITVPKKPRRVMINAWHDVLEQ